MQFNSTNIFHETFIKKQHKLEEEAGYNHVACFIKYKMTKFYLSSFYIKIANHLSSFYPNRQLNILSSLGVESNEHWDILNGAIPNLGSHIRDCGTFSLHFAENVSDEKVSPEAYEVDLKYSSHKYDFYFSFDRKFTIYGAEENRKCTKWLQSKGFNPVPVIHDYYRGELDYYIDSGYDFVALGSIMEKGSSTMLRKQKHIDYAVEKLYQNNVKAHLFGGSSYRAIAHLPLYSCDSSSWAQNNKFGFILYWNPENDGEDKTDKLFFYDKYRDYYSDRPYFEEYDFRPQIEQYYGELGITYHDLTSTNKHYYRQLVNAIYYLTIEDVIKEKHKIFGYS